MSESREEKLANDIHKQKTRELGAAGLDALKRFLSEIPSAAREWPKQAWDMVRFPADLVLGNPEQNRLDRQWEGSSIKPLVDDGYDGRRPGTAEYRARRVMEFANPVANALFAPKQTLALAMSPVGRATLGGLAALTTGVGPVATTPMMAGVVKGKGGNWLTGSVEDALRGLKKAGTDVPMDERNAALETLRRTDIPGTDPIVLKRIHDDYSRNLLMSDWIEGPLTKYIKTRMATPEDEVRKLAEQGVLHFDPSHAWDLEADMARYRSSDIGLPAKRLGKSKAAQEWEDLSDISIRNSYVRDILEQQELPANKQALMDNPWLKDVDPNTIIHNLSDYSLEQGSYSLGFDKLTEGLRNALDPASGLPHHLQLTPEAVQNMSMEKAIRHVADINAWREEQIVEANRALAEKASIVREYAKNNPKGLRWVELKANSKTDEFGNLVNRGDRNLADQLKYEGEAMGSCAGDYCDDVLSGKSRIFSLRDAKGKPHVTVEVAPPVARNANEWYAWQKQNPEEYAKLNAEFGYDIAAKLKAATERYPQLAAIKQIKGSGKKTGSKQSLRISNTGYPENEDAYLLPFVQDFVRNSPLGQQWGEIRDLQNTGLSRFTSVFNPTERAFLKKQGIQEQPFLTQEQADLLRNKWKALSDIDIQGGDYIATQAILEELKAAGFASGGTVKYPKPTDPVVTSGTRGRSNDWPVFETETWDDFFGNQS